MRLKISLQHGLMNTASAAVLAGGLLLAGAASAQTADTATGVAEVVVTASRINTAGFTAPTPTSVVSTEDIQRTAPVQISESLRNMVPAFRTTGASTTPNVYANLRGVGATRTLVLLDGRRIVATQPDGTVDLNLIPAALVSRTEVVTGGASASWGSDAVTGVVNIMLKTNLEGFEGQVQAGVSKYGDKKNYAASVAWGHQFAGGKGSILVGADWAQDRGIEDLQAPYLSRPWAYEMRASVGNSAFATNGQPGVIYSKDVRRADTSTGGLITNGPLRGLTFNKDGTTSQFGFGTVYGNNMIGGTSNLGESTAPGAQLDFPFQKYTGLAHIKYQFTPRFSGFVEGLYSHSLSKGWAVPNRNNGTVTGTTACTASSFQSALGNIAISTSNAYLSPAFKAQAAAAGVTCFGFGRTFRDLDRARSNDGTPDLYRMVTGFNGDLGGGWDIDGYYQYGQSNYQQRRENTLIVNNISQAIDAVVNPANGQIVCRSTLTNPTNGCVPFNIFGENNFSAAAKAYATGIGRLDQRFVQHVGELNLHGSPFALPAGDVQLATGVGYRRESINATVDPISQVDGFSSGNRKGAKGAYNVKEVYGELGVPLLKDRPLFKSLSLNVAARYTDYSTSGGVTTWKIGGVWDLTDEFRLRATRSRDIRAGNLSELFTPVQTTNTNLRNPVTSVLGPAQTATQGNPNLVPERANTFTGGFVYQPRWASGLRASVDYYKINITNAIGTLGGQNVLDLCYLNKLQQYCDLVTTSSAGVIQKVVLLQLNLNRFATSGVDAEVSYRLPLAKLNEGWKGVLSARVLANYTEHLATTASVGATVTDPAGQYTSPHWTVVSSLNYDVGAVSFTVDNQFYGGGKIDKTKSLGAINANGINVNQVGSTIYTNLSLNVDMPKRWSMGVVQQLYFRVNNVFNVWPPFPSNGGGIFDEVGRAYRAGVRFKY